MRDARPGPAITQDTAFFWEGARQHRLLFQRCSDCQTPRHPPSAGCRHCGSPRWKAEESKGLGAVYSFTVLHRPLEEGHVVVLVALDEGIRLISEMSGADAQRVAIGMRVRCDWLDVGDDLVLPVFKAAA